MPKRRLLNILTSMTTKPKKKRIRLYGISDSRYHTNRNKETTEKIFIPRWGTQRRKQGNRPWGNRRMT